MRWFEPTFLEPVVKRKGQQINNVAWVCYLQSYLLSSLSQTHFKIYSVRLGLGVYKPHFPDALVSWLSISFLQQEGSRTLSSGFFQLLAALESFSPSQFVTLQTPFVPLHCTLNTSHRGIEVSVPPMKMSLPHSEV